MIWSYNFKHLILTMITLYVSESFEVDKHYMKLAGDSAEVVLIGKSLYCNETGQSVNNCAYTCYHREPNGK